MMAVDSSEVQNLLLLFQSTSILFQLNQFTNIMYLAGTGLLEVYLEDGDTKYHIDACIYSKIFSGAYVNLVTPAHIAGLISGPDITC